MSQVFEPNSLAGLQEDREPRLLGSIVEEMLHGTSPLAIGYRQYIASQGHATAEDPCGWHRNTDLCVDVKTFLRKDKVARMGKTYPGLLCRDQEEHYSFVETLPATSTAGKRNPHVYEGAYITVTRRDDGTHRLNFKPLKTGANFTVEGYARGVAREIVEALKGLVEEGGCK